MARGTHQKLKLYYLAKIMLSRTDDEHSLKMPEIIAELAKYGISAERKSIYEDFKDLADIVGIEIIKENEGRDTCYHVGAREFELAEIKLLIDAILSSKFITQNKSRQLISKIKGFVSEHQAKQLQRQIYMDDRVKTMNESVFYNVDYIHTAINTNCMIKFKYYRWNINKELEARHDGAWYEVSPWVLVWASENYYMVAFDEKDQKIKHYRVDKMMKISVVETKRLGRELFEKVDMASYSTATFSMFNGEKTRVHLELDNDMCGIFLDRFGKDIDFHRSSDSKSEVTVEVAVSPQFYGWVFSLGERVRIIGPSNVVEEMKKELLKALDNLK